MAFFKLEPMLPKKTKIAINIPKRIQVTTNN